jgi:hypothetical protein
MPTVQVQAELSPEDLLRAVAQLDPPELDQFVSRVVALRAQRQAPGLTASESRLLLTINQGLPADLQQRYADLVARRRAGRLTPSDHQELLGLTGQVERLEAERAQALVELARLRQVPLDALLKELGLPAATYE